MVNKAYLKLALLSESPLRCEYEEGELNIHVGQFQHVSFPDEYILANREQFERLAHAIDSVLQDHDQKEESDERKGIQN